MRFLTTLFFLALLSCKKESACETWEYYVTATSKETGATSIADQASGAQSFCGKDLQDARAGQPTVIETNDVVLTRVYVKRR